MDILKRKRSTIRSKCTRLTNIVVKLEQFDIAAIQIYNEQSKELWRDLNDIHDKILECTDDESVEINQNEYDDIATKIELLQINIANILVKHADSSQTQSVPGTQEQTLSSTVKLPTLQLPTFAGDYMEWISFRDLFIASIHDNHNLSNAQKLQYLKLSLKDYAATLIHSIQISDANYEKAWNILMQRYENETQIVNATLDKLFHQSNVNVESASNLRRILDVTNQCIDTLEIMKQPVKQWDTILIYILKKKLDSETLRQWMLSEANKKLATFDDFKLFLDQRARALASLSTSGGGKILSNQVNPKQKPPLAGSKYRNFKNSPSALYHIADLTCVYCKGNHSIYKCDGFQKLSFNEKRDVIKSNNLCSNCLKAGHFKSNCCSTSCKVCKQKHHTLLHINDSNTRNQLTGETKLTCTAADDVNNVVSNHLLESPNKKQVLLPTSKVVVIDRHGTSQVCRALIDTGSQSSFISETCVQKLGLRRRFNKLKITGISPMELTTSNGTVNITLTSCFDSKSSVNLDMHILTKITCDLPQTSVDTKELKCFNLLKLADHNYSEPSSIDILLGADVCPEILLDGRIKAPNKGILAQETLFGWVIFGCAVSRGDGKPTIAVHHSLTNVDVCLRKFWELEEIPNSNIMHQDEADCVKHFEDTHSRDESGRYTVCLPMKKTAQPLGASRDIAISRFQQMERKLCRQPVLLEKYTNFMHEYLQLGHMELIPSRELSIPVESSCYIPHHSVMKTEDVTGKFRVVFDASAKTTSGTSLNDNLLVGPTIQDSIFHHILRFREYAVVMTADICKMYRQVKVQLPDADFQRIVWRFSSTEPIQDYRLTTVTYGTASAPFLATKCLQQLAADDGKNYPLAAKILCRDFYVDDLMTGTETIHDALLIQSQLIKLLKSGGFELRKWSANNSKIVNSVPEPFRAASTPQQIKTLGVFWHPEEDNFSFKITFGSEKGPITKRSILSNISRVFDPLGWLTPVIIRGKILIQQLWKTKLDWDEQLPAPIENNWNTFKKGMQELQDLRIPRFVAKESAIYFDLLGYCDSSERAYAAVVYIRTTSTDNSVTVNLVAAKSKVAPLKSTSLPRLELCGAHLLAKLLKLVVESSNLTFREIQCWSDSTIVLAWLQSPSSRWKTFVANRVAKIHELLPDYNWHHIPGELNPADCASRGITAQELIHHMLWWNGPPPNTDHTNYQNKDESTAIDENEEALEEEKKPIVCHSSVTDERDPEFNLLEKFSNLSKIKRVTALCFRFINNCKLPHNSRNLGNLTTQELDYALFFWVKRVQNQEFKSEIDMLKQSKSISPKSKIVTLCPFIAKDDVLRVGGRLRNARVSETTKHPILLPKRHLLTDLIVMHFHLKLLHAGPQLLQSCLQQEFWIISARVIIRQLLRKCVVCVRNRAQTAKQIMGDLPSSRVNPSRVFSEAGIDYAGPLLLRVSKGRSNKTFKAYIAVFICFSTRAIHLELVSDLSSEAFIAALKRFIARRGKCHTIHSDCGTNFVGANRELKSVLQHVHSKQHKEGTSKFLSNEGIVWKYNPPAAPHVGGLWEAGVKSVKYHLKRIVGNVLLTYEEMYTVLTQIEACLNSRPLCPLSNDPNDLSALTPGHFLVGDVLTALPDRDLTTTNVNRLTRWQLLQKLVQHFWKRWVKEYLSLLQQRSKWLSKERNIQIGDLVLLKDDRLPPLKWKLGRVIGTFPGADNYIRTVTVKTADGTCKRVIQKLCLLPIKSV